MPIDVSNAVAALLAHNRGPVPNQPDAKQPPVYGIEAALEADCLHLTLTFRSGCTYCCMESGCHLGLYAQNRWLRLRQALLTAGVNAPDQLKLHLHCVVEEGAMFFDFSRPDPKRRGWYAFHSESAYSYKKTIVEKAIMLEQ